MSILRRIQSGDNQSPGTSNGIPAGQTTGSMQTRRIVAPAPPNGQDTYQDLKSRVQNKLLAELDPSVECFEG